MLGVALGELGLSLKDFYALTPEEFTEVVKVNELSRRAEWERARMICGCILQPYAESGFEIRKALPFPWDENADTDNSTKKAQSLTREEELVLFERAKASYGLR